MAVSALHHIAVFVKKYRILLAGDMAGIDMNGFLRPGTVLPTGSFTELSGFAG